MIFSDSSPTYGDNIPLEERTPILVLSNPTHGANIRKNICPVDSFL